MIDATLRKMPVKKSNAAKVIKKRKTVSYKISTRSPDELREDTTPYVVDAPRKPRVSTVATSRKYAVALVAEAKSISSGWLKNFHLENAVAFGLPEVDDRYHIWRVPLVKAGTKERIGEVVIDAYTSLVDAGETTTPDVLEARLLGRHGSEKLKQNGNGQATQMPVSFVRNTVILGDSEQALLDMPSQSVDLIFTSPPYYNARPEYEDYLSYESYLLKMRRIIHNCHRVLSEGRFFVMNVSPVLIRRASRSEASGALPCRLICTGFLPRKVLISLTTSIG